MFQAVLFWEAAKDWLADTLHLTHWDLHVIVGLLLFVLFAKSFRRPLSSFLPLLPVIALELVNEAFDLSRYLLSGWPWTPRATIIEIALTLGPPFVLIGIARWYDRYAAGNEA